MESKLGGKKLKGNKGLYEGGNVMKVNKNTNMEVENMKIKENTNMEEKIMRKMVKMMNKGRAKLNTTFNNIYREEVGASELVVLVALIVIVLAIIIVFRTQLQNIVTTVGAKVINWINSN